MPPGCSRHVQSVKMADVRATFVSQKISKIRWRHCQKQSSYDSDTFVTGSWDDEENKVCLWMIDNGSTDVDMDSGDPGTVSPDPVKICEVPHMGDVTGLEYSGEDLVLASSSTGTVTLYRYHTASQNLGIRNQWKNIHHHHHQKRCPCTCIATRDKYVVTAGEDGRINVLHIEQSTPERVIDKGDSCTVNNLTFLKQTEFITVNSIGNLKTYDLRVNSNDPVQTLSVTGELTPIHSIDKHPGQQHIVITGNQEGVLGVWDLRKDNSPLSLLEAHSGCLWEVKFHKTNPDHLFTCSEDGSVWHWDSSHVGSSPVAMVPGTTPRTGTGAGSGGGNFSSQFQYGGSGGGNTTISNPWSSADVAKNDIEITSLLDDNKLPVNTLDISGHSLLCGSDGETIFTKLLPSLR